MADPTWRFARTRSGRAVAGLALALLLAGCGNHSSGAPAKVDACALVTTAMVRQLAPGLGAGHPSSVPHP